MTRRTQLALGLAVVLVGIGLAIRLWLLVRSGWLMDGDDALSTLMAVGIVDRGERPIMLKNQTYASAWEPYAMALSYVLFGISRVSAKLPELIGSLALIGTSAWLAAEIAGGIAAIFAAVLIAAPPAYALVLWLKPWAPYTEVVLFGTVALGAAVRLAWPRPGQHDARWAALCGAAGGFALWMHPLAVTYLAAAAVSVLAVARGQQRWLRILVGGALGFAVGGLPIWIYNLQTGGATVRFIVSGTGGQRADRLAVLGAWWNNDLPRGIGLWHPWGSSPVAFGVVMGCVAVCAVVWAVVSRRGARPTRLDPVLVFLVLMPTVLVLSGFGGPALNPYGFDATGRYAPPLWAGLAIVLSAALATLWRRSHRAAVVGVLVPVALNVLSISAIDPVAAFQSPYWNRLPVDNGPLLAALRQADVHAVWMNHWAGQPLMFDARAAGQTLVAYDWYDVQAGGIDRFPEYLPALQTAARPAFVLVTDEPEPELEARLRAMGVTFDERRVPPYVVVVPTSRRVDPSEVGPALDYRY